MIRILLLDSHYTETHKITPTIFPDGTSQVWKLPENVINSRNVKIIWHFEAEREIFDVTSLKLLLHPDALVHLHIPYLPFARQDKEISNTTTFNLEVFGQLLNTCEFDLVTSIDVHNVSAPIKDFSCLKRH